MKIKKIYCFDVNDILKITNSEIFYHWNEIKIKINDVEYYFNDKYKKKIEKELLEHINIYNKDVNFKLTPRSLAPEFHSHTSCNVELEMIEEALE